MQVLLFLSNSCVYLGFNTGAGCCICIYLIIKSLPGEKKSCKNMLRFWKISTVINFPTLVSSPNHYTTQNTEHTGENTVMSSSESYLQVAFPSRLYRHNKLGSESWPECIRAMQRTIEKLIKKTLCVQRSSLYLTKGSSVTKKHWLVWDYSAQIQISLPCLNFFPLHSITSFSYVYVP